MRPMEPQLPSLVLKVAIFDAGHPNPRVQLLDVWLATVYRTKMTAIIASEPGTLPRVHRYVELGSLELPRTLRDRLALMCFDRLTRERLLFDEANDRVDVLSAATWINRLFPPKDAAVVIDELVRHIDPDLAAREAAWRFCTPEEK